METLYIILLVLAFVLFLISAFVGDAVASTGRSVRFNLIALGLAAWVLVPLIEHARAA